MNKTIKHIFTGTFILIAGASFYSLQASMSLFNANEIQQDSTNVDTITKATGPQFKLRKDPSFPNSDLKPAEGIQLKQPSNLKSETDYDPASRKYVFSNKIGKVQYRQSSYMSMAEFKKYELRQSIRDYWQTQANGGVSRSQRGFRPSFSIGSEAFSTIFGGNTINIVPQGQAELIFGVNISTTNNPQIAVNQQTTPSFNFEEKIQMNVTGTIGERLKLVLNYNTEATFDFENKTKLEYAGDEDEIIKKIEAGDVTMPLAGTLITGSQSLFGIKTELQFGKLNVTTVLSQQKGQTQVINVQGGAQVSEFSIQADEYEANKHFFLAHKFEKTYDASHEMLPRITSNVNITKLEVWVTNKKGNFESPRKIVAFVDLAEDTVLYRYPDNNANSVYSEIKDAVHNDRIDGSTKFNSGKDYESLTAARKLSETEYSFNPILGFISLNSALNSDEILAVAYEYVVNGGERHQVGELASDNPLAKQPLVLKLIKGTNLSPKLKTWSLMMKNIYSLNAFELSKEDFYLNILYHDDRKGADLSYWPDDTIKKKIPLLQIFNLDNVNNQLEGKADGVFDFVDGVTIDKKYGRIIFPNLKPFGDGLLENLKKRGYNTTSLDVRKYSFPELYDSTQTKAKLIAEKNKFKLKGTYKSASSSEIYLNAMNVPQGSVKVTSGGIPLEEHRDYEVDYSMGTVKIINTGILNSGQPIKVSLENNSMFAVQTKTLVGTHLDYKINDDFNIGATVMHLNERPMTSKVGIGDEPISNTIWGLNTSYRAKSQFLTTLIDKLPLLETKEISQFTFTGEFAQLVPGTSSAIGSNAYVDDFEGSETTYDLRSIQWYLASTPPNYLNGYKTNEQGTGFNRAKIAWYTIDNSMVRDKSSMMPASVKGHKEWTMSHYAREIMEKELFPNKQVPQGIPPTIQILNLTYYPSLKGPYNYDTNIDINGNLLNPKNRWGGIMREIQTNDFEASNVEYIEFWMMDPFAEDSSNTGGEFNINLGSVSEDINKDGKESFENGIPNVPTPENIYNSGFGHVPLSEPISPSFNQSYLKFQDVGLDGLDSIQEREYFSSYVDTIERITGKRITDVSNDDYHHFLDDKFQDLSVVDRYQDYNNMDGNSSASRPSYSNPDIEDINNDNTMSQTESYFDYNIKLHPSDLKVGNNFIVGMKEGATNYNKTKVNWYQFKIPIQKFTGRYGDIEDFKSIRFIRMYMHGFEKQTTLRFASLGLVRGDWREYNASLQQTSESTTEQPSDGLFEIQAVNIEENSNYKLPPGVTREQDPSQPQLRSLNEQAMVLKVYDLADGDARAAFKTANIDMRQYKRLKMFIHCGKINNQPLNNNDLTVFVRLGSDYKNNYYEYEIPLKVSSDKIIDTAIWLKENNMDIELEQLMALKQRRNDENVSFQKVFSAPDDYYKNRKISVCGNPTLSSVKAIMIGIRNPGDKNNPNRNDGLPKTAEIWVNELKLSDFNNKGGWAANARAQIKLADFGNIRLSGSTIQPGFGSIEKKVNEREKAETNQYDVAADAELGKFFPEKAQVRLPVFASYARTIISPQYNPLDPDITLDAALRNKTASEAAKIQQNALDQATRRSLNFTNIKVNKASKKPMPYDPANFSLSYGYNDIVASSPTIENSLQQHHEGGFNYIYNLRPKNVAPLKNVKLFSYKPVQLIRDFNFFYLPNSFAFRTNMIRDYKQTKMRSLSKYSIGVDIDPTVEKNFRWNRIYDFKFDLSRAIKIDFSATNNSRIHEYEGIVEPNNKTIIKDNKTMYQLQKDTIWQSIRDWGQTTNYNQQLNINYNIPINKLPLLDWTTLNTRYGTNYEWSFMPPLRTGEKLGNNIKNSNALQINANASLTTIYNKIPFLKDLQNKPQTGKNQPQEMKTVTSNNTYFKLTAGVPKNVAHKLNTIDVKVTAIDADGKEIKGKTDVVNVNRITFTPDSSATNATITVEGKVPVGPNPLLIIARTTLRILTGIKTISGSYSQTTGTSIPGYLGITHVFGSENINRPGIPFILGFPETRDTSFIRSLKNNNLLSSSEFLNAQVMFINTKTLSLRVNYEPFPGMRIDLTTNHTKSENTSTYYGNDSNKVWTINPPNQTGNFSMTIMSFNVFDKVSSTDYSSKRFSEFLANRKIINDKLNLEAFNLPIGRKWNSYDSIMKLNNYNKDSAGYGLMSQQVLIPAFLSTYGNYSLGDLYKAENLFPGFKYMRPNWRASYDGLSEIEFIKQYCRSVTLNHSYSSQYNMGSYTSNLLYGVDIFTLRENSNYFVPQFDVSSVSINEQFSPLIGVDVTMNNNFTTRFEYKKSRTIALSFSSNTITDMNNNEYVIGAGYRFEQMPLSMIIGSTGANIKSDLNLRADVSLRDDITITRKIERQDPQPSTGTRNIKFSFSADYALSDKLKVRLFFDHTITDPHAGKNVYLTTLTNFGFSVQFTLAGQ